MSAQYEKTHAGLVCDGGDRTCFQLLLPWRGELTRLTVVQVGGADDGFSVDLYNSKKVCPELVEAAPGGSSNSSSSAGSTTPVDIHKIIQTITAVDGTAELRDSDGVDYRNIDGSFSVPEKYLYLSIHPGGSGLKEFDAHFVIKPPALL
jgi:hypothetical protein